MQKNDTWRNFFSPFFQNVQNYGKWNEEWEANIDSKSNEKRRDIQSQIPDNNRKVYTRIEVNCERKRDNRKKNREWKNEIVSIAKGSRRKKLPLFHFDVNSAVQLRENVCAPKIEYSANRCETSFVQNANIHTHKIEHKQLWHRTRCFCRSHRLQANTYTHLLTPENCTRRKNQSCNVRDACH